MRAENERRREDTSEGNVTRSRDPRRSLSEEEVIEYPGGQRSAELTSRKGNSSAVDEGGIGSARSGLAALCDGGSKSVWRCLIPPARKTRSQRPLGLDVLDQLGLDVFDQLGFVLLLLLHLDLLGASTGLSGVLEVSRLNIGRLDTTDHLGLDVRLLLDELLLDAEIGLDVPFLLLLLDFPTSALLGLSRLLCE